MTAATAQAPARTAEKHDNCPKCGFKFPTPQTVCRNTAACERRQKGEGQKTSTKSESTTDAADPKAEVKARIDERAEARRQREAAAAAPAPNAPVETTAVETNGDKPAFKLEVRTDAQVAMVDRLFPGRSNGSPFRSGRAGKRFLVFADEVEAIAAKLEEATIATAEGEGEEARRAAKTIEALSRNFDDARAAWDLAI